MDNQKLPARLEELASKAELQSPDPHGMLYLKRLELAGELVNALPTIINALQEKDL